ncbi:hypothetical protein M3J09_011609 [Ascochyta lentis]
MMVPLDREPLEESPVSKADMRMKDCQVEVGIICYYNRPIYRSSITASSQPCPALALQRAHLSADLAYSDVSAARLCQPFEGPPRASSGAMCDFDSRAR